MKQLTLTCKHSGSEITKASGYLTSVESQHSTHSFSATTHYDFDKYLPSKSAFQLLKLAMIKDLTDTINKIREMDYEDLCVEEGVED